MSTMTRAQESPFERRGSLNSARLGDLSRPAETMGEIIQGAERSQRIPSTSGLLPASEFIRLAEYAQELPR
jgi:hypothetical protein